MNERLADDYQPDFDIDAAVGKHGELFVANWQQSLSEGSVEVKTDQLTWRTGNVYLEHACRYGGTWRPSGVAVSKAEWFAYVLDHRDSRLPAAVIAAPMSKVRAVHEQGLTNSNHLKECIVGSHPTKGIVLPVSVFIRQLLTHRNTA